MGIFSFLGSNPLVILALLATFTFASWGSDVKSWWRERQTVSAWAKTVEEHKKAAEINEQIANNALEANKHAEHLINSLQAQFEAEDIARKVRGDPDCGWSDDDVRVLNSTAVKRPR